MSKGFKNRGSSNWMTSKQENEVECCCRSFTGRGVKRMGIFFKKKKSKN
jgi:hypothetical protein